MADEREDPAEQLGASVPASVNKRLWRYLGKKRIKNAVVEEAINEYLDAREAKQTLSNLELDVETQVALTQFRKEHFYPPSANIAHYALRLLLQVEESSREFVVRLNDESLIEDLDRYHAKHGMSRSRIAAEALARHIRPASNKTLNRTPPRSGRG